MDTNTTVDMAMKTYIEGILDDRLHFKYDTATNFSKFALVIVRNYLLKNPEIYPLDKLNPHKGFKDMILSVVVKNAIDPVQRLAEFEKHQLKSKSAGIGKSTLQMAVQIAIEFSLAAIMAEAKENSWVAWVNASHANYWAGFLSGSSSLPPNIPPMTGFARMGAMARHASDPKQMEKALVKQHWENWEAKPYLYKTQIAFALDMCEKHKNLDSPETIKRWVRAWEKEKDSRKT